MEQHGMSVMCDCDIAANRGAGGKFHYTYIIVNTVNPLGRRYIGKHSTPNLYDGYPGSGTMLKAAWGKYGKENFKRIILGFYQTEAEALVAEEGLLRECKLKVDYYNMIPGGGDTPMRCPDVCRRVSDSLSARYAGLTDEQKILAKAKSHTWLTDESVLVRLSASAKSWHANLSESERTEHFSKCNEWHSDPEKVTEAKRKFSETVSGRTMETHPYIRHTADKRRGTKLTSEEKEARLIKLGDKQQGANHHNAKLSADERIDIVALFGSGWSRREISEKYTIVTIEAIGRIIKKAINSGEVVARTDVRVLPTSITHTGPKLSADDRLDIIRKFESGMTSTEIYPMYQGRVALSTIKKIINRRPK